MKTLVLASTILACAMAMPAAALAAAPEPYASTHKPVLHGRHWVAITGKPLAATAGARMFERGGNAIDAACAMLAVVCTMYDDLSWGRRNAGADLRSTHERGGRGQRAGGRPHGRDGGVVQGQRPELPARRRSTGRRHARQSGRAHVDAGRVRDDVAQRRVGAGHRHGGRLSGRGRTGPQDAPVRAAVARLAVLPGGVLSPSRPRARHARARRDLEPTGPGGHPPQTGRDRGCRARGRAGPANTPSTPRGTASIAGTSRRSSSGARASKAGSSRWPTWQTGARESNRRSRRRTRALRYTSSLAGPRDRSAASSKPA